MVCANYVPIQRPGFPASMLLYEHLWGQRKLFHFLSIMARPGTGREKSGEAARIMRQNGFFRLVRVLRENFMKNDGDGSLGSC